MKTVTTWEDLESEVERLAEWYANALECSEDILRAVASRSVSLLKQTLARHSELTALPPFRVSGVIFDSEGTQPPVRLVH